MLNWALALIIPLVTGFVSIRLLRHRARGWAGVITGLVGAECSIIFLGGNHSLLSPQVLLPMTFGCLGIFLAALWKSREQPAKNSEPTLEE